MAELGVERTTLTKVLNQKSTDNVVTAVYDHYGYEEEKREELLSWNERLREIVGLGQIKAKKAKQEWDRDLRDQSPEKLLDILTSRDFPDGVLQEIESYPGAIETHRESPNPSKVIISEGKNQIKILLRER